MRRSRGLGDVYKRQPSLRVTASEQHYASIDAHCVTHGVGAGADVVGVDARAVVTDYPQVARRVEN